MFIIMYISDDKQQMYKEQYYLQFILCVYLVSIINQVNACLDLIV